MADIINGRYALADPNSGVTVFSLEGGEINMFGSYTQIKTTQRESYPDIHDEPVELKIEKKPNYLSTFVYGFIGTAVSACLAAVAISIVASATVLTGGAALAACAFLGASLGALVATEGMVESDLKTGNNRNPIEFVTGLTGGVFIGFAAGAAVYGVIAAAPALAAGVGQKAVMFLGETSFTTKVVPEIIKASAGAIAAAETVFSINDAYTCGSGYNPLLDVVFDDNIEAYETIEFCVDVLALGYVQAAETYGKTPSDQGVYIENENNLHDYDDGQLDDMHIQGKGGNNEKTIQSNNVKKTGASRAAQYSSSWQSGSVKDSISKLAPGATPVYTDKGKIIYRNESTGIEIVYDRNGNYYRIIDTNLSGKRTALDINGNKVPNNVLTEKGTQRGITQSEYNAITHFNNTDLDFDK